MPSRLATLFKPSPHRYAGPAGCPWAWWWHVWHGTSSLSLQQALQHFVISSCWVSSGRSIFSADSKWGLCDQNRTVPLVPAIWTIHLLMQPESAQAFAHYWFVCLSFSAKPSDNFCLLWFLNVTHSVAAQVIYSVPLLYSSFAFCLWVRVWKSYIHSWGSNYKFS